MKIIVKNGLGKKTECPYSPYSPKHALDSDLSEFDQWHKDNQSYPAFETDGVTVLNDGEYEADILIRPNKNHIKLVYVLTELSDKPVFINRDKIIDIVNGTLGDCYPKLAEMLIIQINEL